MSSAKRPAQRSSGFGAWLDLRRPRSPPARPVVLRPAHPTVSFTFDGFARSAVRVGASLLENVGGRGTYYACAGWAAAHRDDSLQPAFDRSDLDRLIERRHEIGCAGFTPLDSRKASPGALLDDMVRNAAALAALGLEDHLTSFAYPHGAVSAAQKAGLPKRFSSARGMTPGLASGKADLAQLRANALYGAGALPRCLSVLDDARRRSGWVIFHAHDVGVRPGPRGAATALLERLCGASFAAGMRILPVREALDAVLAESAA